jgi:hypothetical protein
MRLDLNLVEIFCCVVEEGSFSKAAEKLRRSQPTIRQARVPAPGQVFGGIGWARSCRDAVGMAYQGGRGDLSS